MHNHTRVNNTPAGATAGVIIIIVVVIIKGVVIVWVKLAIATTDSTVRHSAVHSGDVEVPLQSQVK